MPVLLSLLLYSDAVTAETVVLPDIIIIGHRDCYGIISEHCGGLDYLEALFDSRQYGQRGDRGEVLRTRAAPKSEKNSNMKSEENCKSTRNPVLIATGEKHKEELDFAAEGKYGLGLQRIYRSMQATGTLFGSHWLASLEGLKLEPSEYFQPRSSWPTIPRTVTVIDADGTRFAYDYDRATGTTALSPASPMLNKRAPPPGTNMTQEPSVPESYVYTVSGAAATGTLVYTIGEGWTLEQDKKLFIFNQAHQLLVVRDEAARALLTYTYDTSASQRLQRVTNIVGQSIQLRWGANGHVDQVRDPANNTWSYEYNNNGMLTKVTGPGESPDVRTYHYEASDPTLLTGISIGALRYSTYAYYADRRVETSQLAGAEEKDTFAYADQVTKVTDARGQVTNYAHHDLSGELKVDSVTREASSTCSEATAFTFYDGNGYLDFTRDWNGIKTDYTFDSAGRLLQVTTAAETDAALTLTHHWAGRDIYETIYSDATSTPYLRVNYTLHPSGPEIGRLANVTRTDLTTGVQRQTNYGYSFNPNGSIASETVSDALPNGDARATVYYDALGNISAMTNALNQTRNWLDYNGLGQPGTYVDISGVATNYRYNPNGTLAAIIENGNRVTESTYDHDRQLTSISAPSGQVARLKYNAGGRLEYVGNGLGEFTHIAIDTAANTIRQSSERKVPKLSGATPIPTTAGEFSTTTALDSLGRPYTVQGNDGQRVDFRYDGNGNLRIRTDARGHTTSYEYDAQNRLSKTTAPDGGETQTVYDSAGRLEYVIDPRTLKTTYTYNGFGDRTSTNSPDTGLITYRYDSAGRLETETHADGKVIAYTEYGHST